MSVLNMTLKCIWWSTSSLPLLPVLLWPSVDIPVRVVSMGKIEICSHFLHLKQINCVQTNELWIIKNCFQQYYFFLQIIYIWYICMNRIRHLIAHKVWYTIKHMKLFFDLLIYSLFCLIYYIMMMIKKKKNT